MKILFILFISIFSFSTPILAHVKTTQPASIENYDNDPFEGVNRQIFEFNKVVDEHILHLIAYKYKKHTPELLQVSVNNFFSNLEEIPTLGNQLLQLKFAESLHTLLRFILNTTLGMGGIADVATAEGITKGKEDFGQTLGYYGVSNGPFLVLPILGPSSLRDITKYPADNTMSVDLKQSDSQANSTTALAGLNASANVVDITSALYKDEDPYIKMRSSYLQNREYEVNDGVLSATDLDF